MNTIKTLALATIIIGMASSPAPKDLKWKVHSERVQNLRQKKILSSRLLSCRTATCS